MYGRNGCPCGRFVLEGGSDFIWEGAVLCMRARRLLRRNLHGRVAVICTGGPRILCRLRGFGVLLCRPLR